MSIIIAGTGHRARDCEDEKIVRVKAMAKMKRVAAEKFICGMCDGFDLWAADEAIGLGMDVIAVRPWATHDAGVDNEELYQRVMEHAIEVVILNESTEYPGPAAYHHRNRWMVDNASHIMSYLRPDKTSGGTFQCVKYAKKQGKPVANIYMDAPF